MAEIKPGNDAASLIKAEKKAKALLKADHELHVLLVMKQDGFSKSEALVAAYAEGLLGLRKRMGLKIEA